MIRKEDHALCIGILHDLAQESIDDRQGLDAVVTRNRQIFQEGTDVPVDDDTIVLYDIQNAAIAATDIQTKEPARSSLEPVERGESPICYWNGPPQAGFNLFGLQVEQLQDFPDPMTGQMQPPMPLTDEQADQIRQAIDAGGIPSGPPMVAPGPDGQPVMQPAPMIPVKDDWLVEVNDQLIAEGYQILFDLYWQRSSIDRRWRENVLQTNVDGWTFWIYQFDEDEQCYILKNLSVIQAYPDTQGCADVAEMTYFGVDWVLDRQAATRMYPHLADRIEAWATTGYPRRPDGMTQFGQSDDRYFRRGTVTMRVFWLRNQQCRYTAQEALERGLVVQQEVPDEAQAGLDEANTGIAPAGALDGASANGSGDGGRNEASDLPAAPSTGAAAGGAGEPDAEESQAHEQGEAPQVEEAEDGQQRSGVDDTSNAGRDQSAARAAVPAAPDSQTAPQGLAQPPTRTGLFHPQTGEEVDPDHPAWPTYPCLRQITQLGNEIVDDRRCEFWDIPIVHNVNIPIPQKPFGIGEPYRLWKLQKARSRAVQAKVENAEWFRAPVVAMSKSMAASLKDRYKDAHIKPGRTILVDDDLYKQLNGQIHTIIEPPGMPEALRELDKDLKDTIDDSSGYNEVLRGQPSSQVTSGKMLDSYQAAASSMIGFKSQRTGDMVQRFSHLALHDLVTRVPVALKAQIVRKWPLHIWEEIDRQAQNIEWQIEVTIRSGNGASLTQKKNEAITLFNTRDPQTNKPVMSMQTLREKVALDSRQEERRTDQEARQGPGGASPAALPPAPPAMPPTPPA
jgi:hypothetical protein